jgi:radical SAM superfamily enzyme YgiQ (UPF0313 family)
MGIPALTAYLRSQGVRARAVDLSNAFYYWFLHPNNIDRAIDHAKERFIELNEKSELFSSEIIEYCRLGMTLVNGTSSLSAMKRLTASISFLTDHQKIQASRMALALVSSLHYPESVDMEGIWPYNMEHTSVFDPYSSESILQMVEEVDFLQDFYEEVIPPLFSVDTPLVTGISVGFPSQVLAGFSCAAAIKRMAPKTHVCMGGGFVSCFMRNMKNSKLFQIVDSFVLDEGEEPLKQLVRELSRSTPDLSRVPSLVWNSGEKVAKNRLASPPQMESLPTPDYEVLPLGQYPFTRSSPVLKLIYRLSRGCSWARCAFCRTDLSMINCHQQPEPDYLFENIRSIVTQTGIHSLKFGDDETSPDVLEKLCERLVKENLKITWSTNVRFHPRLTADRCRLFREAGCKILFLGLEAYNDRLLQLMNKATNVKLINRVLKNMKQAGLKAGVYMMVGTPTETKQEALDGLAEIKRLSGEGLIDFYHYSMFQVLPGSTILENPERYRIRSFVYQPNRDLDYPITRFEGDGMSRAQSAQLELDFNSSRFSSKRIDPEQVREIGINGNSIAIKYNVGELMASMAEFASDLSFLPFSEVLKKGRSIKSTT